jgi:ribonuclease J
VPSGVALIDGLGVGDVGNIVLRDRKHLSAEGVIIVAATFQRGASTLAAGPDVISRGFVYVRESEDLMEEAKKVARDSIAKCRERKTLDWTSLKNNVRSDLGDFLYAKTKRKPMILPVFMEIAPGAQTK